MKNKNITETKKYKFVLLKRYFDTGYAITTYVKWFIAFFGLASQELIITLVIGLIYGLSCFVIGWLWFKYRYFLVEQEVSNQHNLFVKEMRKTYVHKKK